MWLLLTILGFESRYELGMALWTISTALGLVAVIGRLMERR